MQTSSNSVSASTGWPGLDPYYKIVPGELTIVTGVDTLSCLHDFLLDCISLFCTGVPNSGKSEWLDALAVNLAELHGWTMAFCSFEKNVKHHTAQLIEKFWGAPVLKVGLGFRGG